MEKSKLVIVESPAKAKTIKKFLGSSYKIEASMGHVRDLPKSQLGVSTESDFEPKYITIRGKGDLIAKLKKEVKSSDIVYLATDPDREGEAISWHLVHALKLEGKEYKRITFNEITKNAVKKSIKEARDIDMNLVHAQQSRRVLDRIVGYQISPLLWKKVKKGLSAGRVQSVALKIICDREEEINQFIPQEYWTMKAVLKTEKGQKLTANFYGTDNEKVNLVSKEQTDKIVKSLPKTMKVTDVKISKRIRKPLPPFTTSTLQQEASKVLGYSTMKTMLLAQQLYEGIDIPGKGTVALVSYIRTDSVRISDEAYNEVKAYILEKFGESHLPPRPEYKSNKRAQEAHEAIRPTSFYNVPDELKEHISKDHYKLYKLIWSRSVSSQMSEAVYDTKSLRITAGKHQFRINGSNISFKGFMEVYSQKDELQEEETLPEIELNEVLKVNEIEPEQHFTQAPPRYTEASLVKMLEEIGVGRPSTYSPTLTTIQQRRYVIKENKNFYPTELGEIVDVIMKDFFGDIINVDFTANLEEELDKVEDGEVEWKEIVRTFYSKFETLLKIAEEQVSQIEIEDEVSEEICENCGKNMVIKYGKFGKFLACPGFPECKTTKALFEEAGVDCPQCGGKILIKKTKKGRKFFGCENNPTCAFISWNKPTGEKCPRCGDVLVEKGSKNKKIVCVNIQCGYFTEKQDKDE